jgi:hypothetical protein
MAHLEAHARRRGETKTRIVERLIEEGLRMDEHPAITFRDGPAGRRAALAGGPDVWEVIDTLQRTGEKGDRAILATAEWGALTVAEVRAAVRYYGEHGDEIHARIRLNREEAERHQEAWRCEQEATA